MSNQNMTFPNENNTHIRNTRLYLGREIFINNSDINFNNANVFIKTPTQDDHMVNKEYIVTIQTNRQLIIQNMSEDRNTNYIELSEKIAELQRKKDELITQLYNLRTYFFPYFIQ
jgi:hypothetical protein